MGVVSIGRSRRKLAVFALGAIGLAIALTATAFVAPNRTATAAVVYTPRDPNAVVAHVPTRDPNEVAARQALSASPDRVELAVELARADIQRSRALQDPRYLGRAQATLGRWWTLAAPPPDVLLLRATIEQSLHDFPAARADLDQLIAVRPGDAQAHLTRAVVATVMADYPAARASCAALTPIAPPIVVATCIAPVDALAGRADDAYRTLSAAIADLGRRPDPSLKEWALTTLAELATQRGDDAGAAAALDQALALDPDDAYARAARADVELSTGHPAAASALLVGTDTIDNLLVRHAIAEHRAHGPDAARLAGLMHARIAAAAERGDRVHLREEARFTLEVDGDATRALPIARDNWGVQHELADARLLAEVAAAAGDADAAAPVRAWQRTNGVHDAQLDHWLGGSR